MKNYLNLLFIFIGLNVFSQQAALNKVAKKVCNYLKTDEYKSLNKEKKTLTMGLKMIEFYGDFEKEFDEDAMESLNRESGRVLGEKIGMQMASICPNELMEMAQNYMNDNDDDTGNFIEEKFEETVINNINGKIITIENDLLSYISIKDNYGKTHQILITEVFEGVDIVNRKNLKKDVNIEFAEHKFYDISEKNYVSKKVLKSISLK